MMFNCWRCSRLKYKIFLHGVSRFVCDSPESFVVTIYDGEYPILRSIYFELNYTFGRTLLGLDLLWNQRGVSTIFLLKQRGQLKPGVDITLHYQHFKCHLHLKWWPVVHQQLHVIRNTAHPPSTQASYTASRVRPKRKISCAAAQIAETQIAATLTICISSVAPHEFNVTSYWGQQRMILTSYPGR